MRADLEFKRFRIKNLEYNITDLEEDTDENNEKVNVKFNIGHSEVKKVEDTQESTQRAELTVSIKVKSYNESSVCDIDLTLDGIFFIYIDSIDEQVYELLRINGTAIMMPYIRNLVSMVSGYDNTYEQILLPTINVNQLLNN